MSLDGALGDVQVASDLRVIAPLQQQIDNLLLARSHRAGCLLHNL
ncbi:MAG: hypothetical protein WBS24_18265 [Terriglobales bacterium]